MPQLNNDVISVLQHQRYYDYGYKERLELRITQLETVTPTIRAPMTWYPKWNMENSYPYN